MTVAELIKELQTVKDRSIDVKVLCTRSFPIPIEHAYHDKADKRFIIETR